MLSNPAHSVTSPYADQWTRLVEIHNHAKCVFLCAEEFDPEFLDFVQPVMELRNGFEHIIRAKASELGLNGEADAKLPDYIPQSFDKAIGHEYRAFFDAADWFSVCIRDRITKTLEHYSHECIAAVLPEYYPKLRPRIDQTCWEIASIRGAKDIAKGKDLLVEVAKYRAAIDELLGIYEQIENSIPAFVVWRREHPLNAEDDIRNQITRALAPYSQECITAVIPDYYPKLRTRIEKTCREIAELRKAKARDLLTEDAQYKASIDELQAVHEQIQDSVPALVDWKQKSRWDAVKVWVAGAFIGGILITVIGALILVKLGLVKP